MERREVPSLINRNQGRNETTVFRRSFNSTYFDVFKHSVQRREIIRPSRYQISNVIIPLPDKSISEIENPDERRVKTYLISPRIRPPQKLRKRHRAHVVSRKALDDHVKELASINLGLLRELNRMQMAVDSDQKMRDKRARAVEMKLQQTNELLKNRVGRRGDQDLTRVLNQVREIEASSTGKESDETIWRGRNRIIRHKIMNRLKNLENELRGETAERNRKRSFRAKEPRKKYVVPGTVYLDSSAGKLNMKILKPGVRLNVERSRSMSPDDCFILDAEIANYLNDETATWSKKISDTFTLSYFLANGVYELTKDRLKTNSRQPKWTEWDEWGPCSVTCGDSGYRTRKRVCIAWMGLNCGTHRQEFGDCPPLAPCKKKG